MNQTVLVVGAASPLGVAICTELRRNDHDVVATALHAGVDYEELDIGDLERAGRLLSAHRPESVVYLARPRLDGADDVGASIADAVGALREFAAQCASVGVRAFVFASSAAVYRTDSGVPSRETDIVHGETSNASLKLRSEEALRAVSESTGLPAVALRIFNAYGPGLDASLVNRLALGGTPEVYQTDTFVRDYVHARDVARAFAMAVAKPGIGMTIANVGTGIRTSNRGLLDLCPTAPYRASRRVGVPTFSVADISFAHRTWGFEPQVALKTALEYPEEFLR
jgi:nucleoside-diphosphate-sugar epimerase